MPNPNIMVVFGPTPDSYFITYGRKMSWSKMPEGMTKTFTTEPDMNPLAVAWIRLKPNSNTWAAMNIYNQRIFYDTSIEKELSDLINVTKPGANRASSISWTDDGKGYFARVLPGKEWTADLPDDYPHRIIELRSELQGFDQGLKTILFGQGGTHIYVFERGFSGWFVGTADDPEHPLFKTVKEFSEVGWNIIEGSSLSPYDNKHFCLKFQKDGSDIIQMRWNLPAPAEEALKKLQAIFNDPEEQAAIIRYETEQHSLGMMRATSSMMNAMTARMVVNNMMWNRYY